MCFARWVSEFLDSDYGYKSLATQIFLDAGLAEDLIRDRCV